MKIIREGNVKRLLKTKRFTCKECGCVFEANKGEYESGVQYNEEYFYCQCPTCKRTAYSDERA